MTGAETLHPPREILKAPPLPPRPPQSDAVGPMLIIGGANVHRLPGLDALAQEIRERVSGRRLELRRCAFHHDAAQGVGVNVWAVSPAGRDWIGTAAGIGVDIDSLAALIAPHNARAAA